MGLRNNIEDAIQASIVEMVVVAGIDNLECFAVPNGEYRDIKTARKLKATGVKAGVTDLIFIHPRTHVAHFLEVKTEKGVLSPAQALFRDKCIALGHPWGLARSRDDAQDILTFWGMLRVLPQSWGIA